MRKIAILLALAFLALNFTSCYDASEIDDLAHVVAIGVDKGISDKWRLTVQFHTMKESGGGGGESGGSGGDSKGDYSYVSIDAPSFFAGISMLNASLPRKLNFMHAHIIAFSEEVAKAGLIGEYISPLVRFRQIRWSSHVFVVKGKAIDFIKENNPFIGKTVSKGVQLLISEKDNTGYFPHTTLEDLYTGIKSSYHQAIVPLSAVNDSENFKEEGEPWGTEFTTGGQYVAGQLPRSGDNKIELFGTALFDRDTMVGELNGDETRYLLMVQGEFKHGLFTMQDPQNPEVILVLDVTSTKKPDIKVTFEGLKPIIQLKVELDADILSIQSNINYEKPELQVVLEDLLEKTIYEGLSSVIQKCQNLNVDAFEFGYIAARKFLTIDEWENYNWNSHFKEAAVTIEVEVIIRRTGTQIKTYPITGAEGTAK